METTLKRQPVVIVFSILAALQVISAGLALIDSIDKDVAAIVALVLAALQTGAAFYVRGMVTPWDTVVSKVASNGEIIAGPAAKGSASSGDPD